MNVLLIVQYLTNKIGIKAEPNKTWFEDENGRFKWSFGCNFPSRGFSMGNIFSGDVDKIKKNQSSTCPRLCYENHRCTHFIYTNGYCHMKMFKLVDASPKGAIYNNPGGLCGFVVNRPVQYILGLLYINYSRYALLNFLFKTCIVL